MDISWLGDWVFKISQVSRQETCNYHRIRRSFRKINHNWLSVFYFMIFPLKIVIPFFYVLFPLYRVSPWEVGPKSPF